MLLKFSGYYIIGARHQIQVGEMHQASVVSPATVVRWPVAVVKTIV